MKLDFIKSNLTIAGVSVTEKSRFLRRVAMGSDPYADPISDPLSWATSQLEKVPEIRIYDQQGKVRVVPGQFALISDIRSLMVEYRNSWNAVDGFFVGTTQVSKAERRQRFRHLVGFPFRDVAHWKEVQARLTTAQWSEQPVFERFWHFWTNHFMVAPNTDNNDVLVGPYQRHLRSKLTGSFRDLLWEAVTHPSMLIYLDNYRSVGPNSIARKSGRTTDSINENLGRELLELFTISPAAGYTQKDVEASTMILTGWTFAMPNSNQAKPIFPSTNAPASYWGTFFAYQRHEPGVQTLMGKQYENSLFRQKGKLEDLINDLAIHPATAKHLARKLCTYFMDDAPPAEAVAHVESVFLSSKGNLPAVHQAVLEMCWRYLSTTRKLVFPDVWLVQCAKAMSAPLPQELPTEKSALNSSAGPLTTDLIRDLGMPLPFCPQPDGWPIKSSDWLSGEMLDRRVRTAVYLAKNSELVRENKSSSIDKLVERTIPRDAPSHTVIRASLARGELADALTLWALSPDVLWS